MTVKITDDLKSKILNEFIHGYTDDEGIKRFPSVDGLSRRHNVARASLYRTYTSEQWQSQKNQYQSELQEKINKERLVKNSEESLRLDDSCIQLSMAMITVVGKQIQGIMIEQGESKEVNAHQLHQLSDIATKAQRLGKLALGEAQEISRVSANVSNPESFRAVMEQLDELAASRSQSSDKPVH
tara:strand:- start:144 stop:695 length:552 start_codon:yes stop_codon:yes gene_type:complete